MSPLLSKLVNFFTYKEPTNQELGFELLEDANEGNENANQKDDSIPNKQQTDQHNPQSKQQNSQQLQQQKQINKKKPQLKKESTQQLKQQNNESGQQVPPGNVQQPPQKSGRERHAITPLSVDEWAKKKKAERGEQSNSDQSNVSPDLQTNLDVIKSKFHYPDNMDLIIREFNVGRKIKAFMVYIENMVDKKQLNLTLLPQLMANDVFGEKPVTCPVDYLIENVIAMSQIKKTNQYHEAVRMVLSGGSVLFLEGCSECVMIKTFGAAKRGVEQPITESVISGSQEGFTEHLFTNVSLIRRIIKNENLIVRIIPVGNTNHSNCAVMYLDGVVNQSIVAEVMKRVKRINAGFIAGSGFIEQFIEDNPYMLFPQMHNTERPDRAASFVMDGLVVIIADGTPRAICVPCTFFRLMQTSEDANLRWPYGNFLRLIRYVGLITSIFLPGMYVALILFHSEMLPTEMLVSILTAKEKVPFPTLVEVLILEISFEMVREGAVRVPGVIGQTLGIVGALILGQAAVTANLVNPVTVIIISLTSIGSFTIPSYELGLAMRISRFAYILAGSMFGFFGISIMLCVTFLLACSMKSFGIPYFVPVSPKTRSTKDTVLQVPLFAKTLRPDALNTPDRTNTGENVGNWTQKSPANEKGDGT